jgi:hypothetical protein
VPNNHLLHASARDELTTVSRLLFTMYCHIGSRPCSETNVANIDPELSQSRANAKALPRGELTHTYPWTVRLAVAYIIWELKHQKHIAMDSDRDEVAFTMVPKTPCPVQQSDAFSLHGLPGITWLKGDARDSVCGVGDAQPDWCLAQAIPNGLYARPPLLASSCHASTADSDYVCWLFVTSCLERCCHRIIAFPRLPASRNPGSRVRTASARDHELGMHGMSHAARDWGASLLLDIRSFQGASPLEQVGAENGAFLGTLPESLNSIRVCHWDSFLGCLLGGALALASASTTHVCMLSLDAAAVSNKAMLMQGSCKSDASIANQLGLTGAARLRPLAPLALSLLTCSYSGSLQTLLVRGLMASMCATKQASARKQALRV